MSETIEFNGIKFRRYPDSSNGTSRKYYAPSATYRRRGVGFLHQEIWKSAHGDIPTGYHIHHRDGNPLNNDIDNLECVPAFDHLSRHATDHAPGRAHMERIRPLATEWHKSEEGREWHRQHAHQPKHDIELVCDQCGCKFVGKMHKRQNFCSDKCRSAWRRRSGRDDIEKTCPTCGKTFKTNKYGDQQTCSRLCGASYRRSKAR